LFFNLIIFNMCNAKTVKTALLHGLLPSINCANGRVGNAFDYGALGPVSSVHVQQSYILYFYCFVNIRTLFVIPFTIPFAW